MSGDRITIGKFSSLTYLSQRALRLYDRKGILVPWVRDRITGYRYYTLDQIGTALKIKTLCNLGFGLSDIAVILSAHEAGDQEAVRQFISRRHRETVAEIERLEKITCLLMENRDFSELFKMNVSKPVIKDVPALRILSGRRTGTYEEVCSKVSEALFAIIFNPVNQKSGVTVSGPCLSLCYDNEYREDDADIEMAVPIQGQIVIDDPAYSTRTLPPTKVISVVYKGPYEHDGFSVAFENAFKFAAENGFETGGPDRQLYLNDPDVTPAGELLTEIQIPLKE
ncbi:MAG: GyrI-like domain-containing protein [Methanoregulaceae archaeon]|jgi:effector-binding domain-containing protein|nr:GyrI-like domain-containing protein [Methanoregulaceae archaeon]